MPESVCLSMILGNALGRSLSPPSNSSWCICFTDPSARSQRESELTKGNSYVHRRGISARNCIWITDNDVTSRHKLGGAPGTACSVRNANGLYGLQVHADCLHVTGNR